MSLRRFPLLIFIALIALRSVGAAAVPMMAGAEHVGIGGVVCLAGVAQSADHVMARHSCCDVVPPAEGTPSSQHHVSSSCSGLCAMAAALPMMTGVQMPDPGVAPVPIVHALSSLIAPPPLEPPRI